jgi:hypothetical protein
MASLTGIVKTDGMVVGRIESWTPSPARDIKPIYELHRGEVRGVTVYGPLQFKMRIKLHVSEYCVDFRPIREEDP